MKMTKTRPWDAAKHLETAEDMAAYLEAVIKGNPEFAMVLKVFKAPGLRLHATAARL